VLPERVNDGLLEWLGDSRLKTVVVVHANHANEIDASVRAALARLKACGAALFNQSVLLRGVNDNADALARLSEVLFASGVIPYYLHLLDKVQGAAHFDVPEVEARSIMAELSKRLPGYLVPRLVRETPGQPGKVSVI
jgi:KamA family protein